MLALWFNPNRSMCNGCVVAANTGRVGLKQIQDLLKQKQMDRHRYKIYYIKPHKARDTEKGYNTLGLGSLCVREILEGGRHIECICICL